MAGEENIFNNEFVNIYNASAKYGVPVRFIVRNIDPTDSNEPYVSVLDYLTPELENLDLSDILDEENKVEKSFLDNFNTILKNPLYNKLSFFEIIWQLGKIKLAEYEQHLDDLVRILNAIFEANDYTFKFMFNDDLKDRIDAFENTMKTEAKADKKKLKNIRENRKKLLQYKPKKWTNIFYKSSILTFKPDLIIKEDPLVKNIRLNKYKGLPEIVKLYSNANNVLDIVLIYVILFEVGTTLDEINSILGKNFEDGQEILDLANTYYSEHEALFGERLLPLIDDVRSIVDEAVISQQMPYLSIDIETNVLTKIYKGDTNEGLNDYSSIIPVESDEDMKNVFQFTVWLGTGNILETPKNTFMHGTYDIINNVLSIPTRFEQDLNKENIITRLENAFPQLSFDDGSEGHISATLNMLDVELNEIIFVDMILNDPIVNNYLFINETVAELAKKSQLRVHYRQAFSQQPKTGKVTDYVYNPSSVSATLNSKKVKDGQTFDVIEDDQIVTYTPPVGQSYIEILISGAISRDELFEFINLLSYLMSYMLDKNNTQVIAKIYSDLIPGIFDINLEKPKKTAIKKPGKHVGSDLQELKEMAPDIFISSYARDVCQNKKNIIRRPVIVNEKNVKLIRNVKSQGPIYQEIGNNRKTFNGQVLAMTSENGQTIYLGCGDKLYQYPGLRFNKLDNAHKHPCLPCCYVKDNIGNPNSVHYQCIKGIQERLSKKTDRPIQGNRALDPQVTGILADDCRLLIARILNFKPEYIYRYGSPISPNSIFHCLLYARNDIKYREIQSNTKLTKISRNKAYENYFKTIRKNITKKIYPGLLKQELFDYTDTEIKEMVENSTLFADTRYFFREFEEYFKINLFIFESSQEDETIFEYPSFSIFPIRHYNSSYPVVLVYKSYGSTIQKLVNHQYELIIYSPPTQDSPSLIFPKESAEVFYNAYIYTFGLYTWKFSESGLNTHFNIQAEINPNADIFKGKATAQLFDNAGKNRGLIIKDTNITFAAIFQPTIPLNLPTGQLIQVNALDVINYITMLIDSKETLYPSRVSRNNQSQITGLWYSYGETEGIYIPVEPADYDDSELQKAKTSNDNPLESSNDNSLSKHQKITRDLEIIKQFIIWLYCLYSLPNKYFDITKYSIDDFTQKYFIIDNNPNPSQNIYDFTNLNLAHWYFENVQTIDDALTHYSKIIPSFIQDKGIYLYTEKFANGLKYFMKIYAKEHDGLTIIKPRSLIFTHYRVTDFKPQDFVNIFVTTHDFQSWLKTRFNYKSSNLQIVDEIQVKYKTLFNPYIYHHTNGNFYLIQNVDDGSLERVYTVGLSWLQYNINPGFYAEPSTITPVNQMYNLTSAGILNDITEPPTESQFVAVLDYGNQYYAAILTLSFPTD